jgi:hypothetical protein
MTVFRIGYTVGYLVVGVNLVVTFEDAQFVYGVCLANQLLNTPI